MFRHALNCVQHFRLQPAISAEGSNAVAVHVLLQEFWLLAEHGDFEGLSD